MYYLYSIKAGSWFGMTNRLTSDFTDAQTYTKEYALNVVKINVSAGRPLIIAVPVELTLEAINA